MRRQALVALTIAGAASAACLVLIALLAARDDAPVRAPGGPGRPPRPGDPPVAGPHRMAPVVRDGVALTRDQALTALAAGDVIVFSPAPSAPLRRLQRTVAGPFSPALAAAGQAVVLARRPGPVIAAAWNRVLIAGGPGDPRLRDFAESWLGRSTVP